MNENATKDQSLTKEDWNRAIEIIFRKRPEPKVPNHTFDFELARKHRLRFSYDGETVLMGSSEMKRARKLGIVKDLKHERHDP